MALLGFFNRIHGFPLDRNPDPVAVAQLHVYSVHLHHHLLPQLGLFDSFDVHFVAPGSLGRDILGTYITGSWQQPAVLLDLQTCREIARQKWLKRSFVNNSTVVHELAHAIQDAYGLPYAENEAEDFAQEFCRHGVLTNFWRR